MGAGNDQIINSGSLTITSLADAHSYAYADTRDNNLADEYETSKATSEAVAVGIHGGAGNNDIENTGNLNVSAKALARVYVGGGHASVTASTESRASATGMTVGDGGSYIRNAGTIDVHALAYYINGAPTHSVSAVGILGGHGDDIIVNEGQIITAMYSGVYVSDDALANIRPGLGIDAGAGNDTVILTDGSSINGAVYLGEGDDTLTLTGNPVINGQILAGQGTDTLLFDGAGSFGYTMQGFSHAMKQGPGTYTISGLQSVKSLEVGEGILEINSDYQFSDSGLYQTTVYRDGTCGQLRIVGTGQLDGSLSVEQEKRLYCQPMTYDIIQADTLNGSFSDVTLPETLLLDFSMQQTSDRVQVLVTPQCCTTVASNKVERNIGEYLDRIMPQATGDLSNMLCTFQALSAGEFSKAFASLSPALHDSATTTTFDITTQYTHTLFKRMHSMRSYIESIDAGLVYSQTEQHATWMDGFGHWAEQDSQDGFAGYDYHLAGAAVGIDRLLEDDLLMGISYGQSNADIDMDNNMGSSNIESYFASIYGSYFTEYMYFDTTLSYGRQCYDNIRAVTIGALNSVARSEHCGNAYSAHVETGRNFGLKRWTLQPFAALRYTFLDEDGYNESGTNGFNLRVEDRQTDSLVSDLGLRFNYPFKNNNWLCITEATVAWNHDFDVDDRRITAAFDGSPSMTFVTDGRDIDENGVILGAGLTFINKDSLSLSMRYMGELRSNSKSHAITFGFRYEF